MYSWPNPLSWSPLPIQSSRPASSAYRQVSSSRPSWSLCDENSVWRWNSPRISRSDLPPFSIRTVDSYGLPPSSAVPIPIPSARRQSERMVRSISCRRLRSIPASVCRSQAAHCCPPARAARTLLATTATPRGCRCLFSSGISPTVRPAAPASSGCILQPTSQQSFAAT